MYMYKLNKHENMQNSYVNNHETATRVLHGLEQAKNFQEFCNQQQQNPKAKGLNLSSFLILPIQRVPRYELCLRVKRYMQYTHPQKRFCRFFSLCA